ncbi:unnamed protein product [Prunus armeniaca]
MPSFKKTYIWFSLMVVSHDGALHLNQLKYVHDLLHNSNLLHAKPASTHLAAKSVLTASDGDLLASPTEYRELVGSLQYLTLTLSYISFVVNTVAHFMSSTSSPHMVAVKRILRYVKGTIDFSLHFTPQDPSTRHTVYSDADWAGCPDYRRSTAGYLIYLGSNLISWCSKKQPIVSHSSAESEYCALAHAWLNLLSSVLCYMNWVFDCLFQFSCIVTISAPLIWRQTQYSMLVLATLNLTTTLFSRRWPLGVIKSASSPLLINLRIFSLSHFTSHDTISYVPNLFIQGRSVCAGARKPEQAGARTLEKEEKLYEISRALAILASASSVSREREEFLRLVNKGAYKVARDESDSTSVEVEGDEVSSVLINKVDAMLQNLEKEIVDVDAHIGDCWQLLDR